MKINIKTLDHTSTFNVLRVFKTLNNRVFILTSLDRKFILIELIAFNYLTVINEIEPDIAGEWTIAAEDEKLKYLDLE